MKLFKCILVLIACIPLSGLSSEHPSTLLDKIRKQLKTSGIESFQRLTIEKSAPDVVVDIDISTTSVTSGACITKVAQLIFSDGAVDETYEDQLWLGSCNQAEPRNAVSISNSADVESLVKLMLDAKSIFLDDGYIDVSRYFFESKSLLRYKGRASNIIFIEASKNKTETVLSFAIEDSKEKVFLEMTSLPKGSKHEGRVRLWNVEFDFKN